MFESGEKVTAWGTPKEVETRRRIIVSVWAYAYEVKNVSLVPDNVFDAECYMLAANLRIDTDRLDLDYWFRGAFDPSTGMWIHKHPELDKIAKLYERLRS